MKIVTGYMKSVAGEDDFGVFVNENFGPSEGGMSWNFKDYEPKDPENYRKIYICIDPKVLLLENMLEEIEAARVEADLAEGQTSIENGQLRKKIEELQDELLEANCQISERD